MMTTARSVDSFRFQAETSQLLDLMIHSLYSQRDIFLRELISNASDALDRLRLEALTNSNLVPVDHKYEIRLKPDVAGRTLTISDTGIGMSRQELIDHIGTIARSGTQELRKRLKQVENREEAASLIGQFGVGFYSAFMVADSVEIVTRRAGDSCAALWQSSGDGSYTITEAEKAGCGTDITLRMKDPDPENGIDDYTDRWKLSMIVRKYSDFIAYPVIYEGPPQEPESGDSDNKGVEIATSTLNSIKPIWTRNRSEVRASDYQDFYQHISDDIAEHLEVLALKGEGTFEWDALLFIPSRARFDLFYHGTQSGLRLYAKRVMVMESCEDLLPSYLRFIKGVVDCSDLPLNISRQRLQQDRQITKIRNWLARKVLDKLAEMKQTNREKYLLFWGQFGRVMKEGVSSDVEHRERLLPLLLFASSHHASELTTLDGYLERMQAGQDEILYLTGESRTLIERSPHLEAASKGSYEVLFLSDPVDELVVQAIYEFRGKRLKSLSKGTLQLGSESELKARQDALRNKEREYAPLLDMCQTRLNRYVKQVRLSTRLVNSPACLVTEEHEYSPHLERLLHKGKDGGPKQRRILELNPDHPIIAQLYERIRNNAQDPAAGDSIEVLFELALLAEGSEIGDPVRLSQLTLAMLKQLLASAS